MKKKFLMLLLAICLVLPCTLMLTACDKEPDCDHSWALNSEPTVEQTGNASCIYCMTNIEFPILNETDYQTSGNVDHKTYSYTKYNKTFNFYVSNFQFTWDGNGYCVTGYTGNRLIIEIPQTTNGSNGEHPVISVGAHVFSNRIDINSVMLPSEFKKIHDNAFNGCTNLSSINLPQGLEYIGESAFAGSKLTQVVIPDSVTELKAYAFYNCSSLETVVIGNEIECIKQSAFEGCTALTEVTIGNSVKQISEYAFSGCIQLENIDFGTAVKYIYNDAFFYCSSLENILLPLSIQSVFESAFAACDNLNKIYWMGTKDDFCEFESAFTEGTENGETDIYYYCENQPTAEDKYVMGQGKKMWHYNNDDIVEWPFTITNNVYRKQFVHFQTEVTITNEYWSMLQEAKSQGTLSEIFGEDQDQIELVINSATKSEYETNLAKPLFNHVYFDRDINGNPNYDQRAYISKADYSSYSYDIYYELDGQAFVNTSLGIRCFTYNEADNTIYEEIITEHQTIKYIYTLYVPEY